MGKVRVPFVGHEGRVSDGWATSGPPPRQAVPESLVGTSTPPTIALWREKKEKKSPTHHPTKFQGFSYSHVPEGMQPKDQRGGRPIIASLINPWGLSLKPWGLRLEKERASKKDLADPPLIGDICSTLVTSPDR